MTKNERIKLTKKETRVRRKGLVPKVFRLKIDSSRLSNERLRRLEDVFLQAKWIYNFTLSSEDPFRCDWKVSSVPVKVFNPASGECDIVENRAISMGSQIKQAMFRKVSENIVNLAKMKRAGLPVGPLKHAKEVKSVELKQHGTTFLISENRVRIQNVGWVKVRGTDQITGEIANARLVRKASGLYVYVTCYTEKEPKGVGEIGIDLGIKDTITFSDGRKLDVTFDYPEALKRAYSILSRKEKGSKNYIKQRGRIRKISEHWCNQKDDASNKIVHDLKKYETVYYQDENIAGWQSDLFGKKVSVGILGRIKSRLKKLQTSVEIDRYLPTTKRCECGAINEIPLSQRIYRCPCGYERDRDIHAANNMIRFGKIKGNRTSSEKSGEEISPNGLGDKNPPTERRFAPAEKCPKNRAPSKQEAPVF